MEGEIAEEWDLCEDDPTPAEPAEKPNGASMKDFEIFDQAIPASKLNMTPFEKTPVSKDQISPQDSFAENLGNTNPTTTPSPYKPSSQTPQSFIRALGFQSTTLERLPNSFRMATSNRFTRTQLSQFAQDAEMAFSHPLPYFFCGSFIFPACLRVIANGTMLNGIAKSMTPATLRGYRRYAVNGQPYPAMLPFASAVPGPESDGDGDGKDEEGIVGMLAFGMLESQRRAIHRFENGMFDLRRERVEVELVGGERVMVEAGIYVWNRGRDLLVDREKRDWRAEVLMESAWFKKIVASAEEEEKALVSGGKYALMGDW